MQLPRLLYKASQDPEAWALESGRYALREVKDKAALEAALAEGWHIDQYAAKDAGEDEIDAPATREELEAKATELGIKFDGRTTDRKLAEAISKAL